MKCLITLCALVFTSAIYADDFRTWTDSTGKHKTVAILQSVKEGNVVLLKASGQYVTVPIDRLSSEDQLWITNARKNLHEQKLAEKRKEHQSWLVREVDHRAVTITTPTGHVDPRHNSASFGSSSYRSTERYFRNQHYQGELVSIDSGQITVNVTVFWVVPGGPQESYDGGTVHRHEQKIFAINNLSAADQAFIKDYRKIQRGD